MKHSHEISWFILLIIGWAGLAGCSSSPAVSDARKVLENRINAQSKGIIKLISFNKLYGDEIQTRGKTIYIMNYDGEIEFAADCYWKGQAHGFEVNTWILDLPGLIHDVGKKRLKGARERISGSIRFEKTEEGWQEEGRPKAFSVFPPAEPGLILGDLSRVAAIAYQYRLRPTAHGGGGGSYVGFKISAEVAQGVSIVSISDDEMVLEKDGLRGTVDSNGSLRTR